MEAPHEIEVVGVERQSLSDRRMEEGSTDSLRVALDEG